MARNVALLAVAVRVAWLALQWVADAAVRNYDTSGENIEPLAWFELNQSRV